MTTKPKHAWSFIPVLSTALFSVSVPAQSGTPTIPPSMVEVSSIPASGVFWSMESVLPPNPFDPLPSLSLYTADGTNYYYDDRDFDYSTYGASLTSSGVTIRGGMVEADDSGPPSPGSGSGGGSGGSSFTLPDYSDASCPGNFWLVISNSPGTSQVFVGITNTIPGTVYNLLTNVDLAVSNGWHLQESLTASSSIVWATPTAVAGTTNLFYMAQIIWPTLLWVTNLPCFGDEWGPGISSSPALSLDGNHVYISSTGNILYSINSATGEIEFTNGIMTSDGEITSSPAVATNGDIIIGSTDGFLYSFATNLTVNWSNNLGGFSPDDGVFATPAVTAGNTIYVGTDDAGQVNVTGLGFFSFNTDSDQNWFFSPQPSQLNQDENDVDGSAIVGPDCTVYFLAEDNRLHALYPDGNVKWFLPVPGDTEPDSTPSISPDGTIYVGSDSPYLYAINPDGSLKWTFHIPNTDDQNEAIFSSPVVDSNGTVYVGGTQDLAEFSPGPGSNTNVPPGGIYAINNGKLIWAFTNVPGGIAGSVALAEDGTVYAGAISSNHTFGILYAITNGVQKWAFQTSNDIVSSPTICSDGSVIVTDEGGNVYKIAGCSPLADSPWPMFHHDQQHTGSLTGTNSPTIGCEPAFPNNGESSGGQSFTFQITGRVGSNWSVFASTNLTNMVGWTNTGTNVNLDSSGSGSFFDPNPTQASNVFYFLSNNCCSEVIGFVAFTVGSGTNLVADPFYEVDDSVFDDTGAATEPPMNTADALFCGGNGVSTFPGLPDGVNAIGWNRMAYVTNTFDATSRSFVPDGDIPLVPGEGAILDMRLNNSQTIWFAGLVRQVVTNQIAPGTNFLGSALPISGRISTDLGYTNAEAGDLLLKWDPTNQVYINFTNNGGANWSPREPYIGLCEGFVLHSATNHVWIQKFSPCGGD